MADREFYLMSNGERSVVTDEPDLMVLHRDGPFGERGTILASDWLHAKEGFGFELTSLQESLIGKSLEERRAIIRRTIL